MISFCFAGTRTLVNFVTEGGPLGRSYSLEHVRDTLAQSPVCIVTREQMVEACKAHYDFMNKRDQDLAAVSRLALPDNMDQLLAQTRCVVVPCAPEERRISALSSFGLLHGVLGKHGEMSFVSKKYSS